MQLVAYGAQDIYLTGQPQITFFKAVYRRHTNFAMESIQQVINGSPATGTRVEITAARNGDLVLGAHVQLDAPATVAGAFPQRSWSYENFCFFDRVEMEIGGQKIDTIYGDWMTLYAELVFRQGYDTTNAGAAGDGFGSDTLATALNNVKGATTVGAVYIPLLFYFNNNPGLAIPLVALQYHEVKFILHIATAARINTAGGAPSPTTGQVAQLVNAFTNTGNVDTAVASLRFFI